MGWIQVNAKRNMQDKALAELQIAPVESDFAWCRTAILAEDIFEVYEDSEGNVTIEFINDRHDMEIQESFNDILAILNKDHTVTTTVTLIREEDEPE